MDDEFEARLQAGEKAKPRTRPRVKGAETKYLAEGLPEIDPKHDYVRIVLSHDQNIPPTGQFFGVNGRGYILKAGVPADVPRAIVDILNNAVYEEPDTDPQTNQVVGYRPRLRFPYTLVGEGQRAA